MTYTIINASSKKDPETGLLVHTQSLVAKFRNSAPGQVAQWDPNRLIDNYIRNEITSGKIEPTDEAEEERRKWLTKVITRFIEKHLDFQTGMIWKAPTKEEIKQKLEDQKLHLEEEIKKYDEIKVTDEDVKQATEEAIKETNTGTKKMVYGGGVLKDGSTAANKR